MTYSLAVLFAASLLIPIAASAQVDLPNAQAQEPAPAILALTTSSRAGISPNVIASDGKRDLDSPVKRSTEGARGKSVAVGGLVGVLTGGVLGAAIGGIYDSTSDQETMIPGFFILGVLGAAAGLVVGLIVGAIRPVS